MFAVSPRLFAILASTAASSIHRPAGLRRRFAAMQVLAQSTKDNVQPAAQQEQPPAKQPRLETLRVQLLSPNASVPKRGSAGAAGYDLARYVVRCLHAKYTVHSSPCLQCHRLRCPCARQGLGPYRPEDRHSSGNVCARSTPLRTGAQAFHRHRGGCHRRGLPGSCGGDSVQPL
jgi:hypothetical protein